jgi:hypothetical protein
MPLMRSSSTGTTRRRLSRNRSSPILRGISPMNVRSEVSGFLISWARPAASVPSEASRSERRSWSSSSRTRETSRSTPTTPSSLPSAPRRGAVLISTASDCPPGRTRVSECPSRPPREASVSMRASATPGARARASVQKRPIASRANTPRSSSPAVLTVVIRPSRSRVITPVVSEPMIESV